MISSLGGILGKSKWIALILNAEGDQRADARHPAVEELEVLT
jgi:hypothetical protein